MALFPDNINSSSKQVAEGRVREWTLMSLSQELTSLKDIGMCNVVIASGHTYFKNITGKKKTSSCGRKNNVQKIEIKLLCYKFTD